MGVLVCLYVFVWECSSVCLLVYGSVCLFVCQCVIVFVYLLFVSV